MELGALTLTPAQVAQAQAEGWKIQGGYVARFYGPYGTCPHSCTEAVVAFLCARAATSEWHMDVFMALPWTSADTHISHRGGWYLRSDGFCGSTRGDLSPEQMTEEVATAARHGDPISIKALATGAKIRLLQGM